MGKSKNEIDEPAICSIWLYLTTQLELLAIYKQNYQRQNINVLILYTVRQIIRVSNTDWLEQLHQCKWLLPGDNLYAMDYITHCQHLINSQAIGFIFLEHLIAPSLGNVPNRETFTGFIYLYAEEMNPNTLFGDWEIPFFLFFFFLRRCNNSKDTTCFVTEVVGFIKSSVG